MDQNFDNQNPAGDENLHEPQPPKAPTPFNSGQGQTPEPEPTPAPTPTPEVNYPPSDGGAVPPPQESVTQGAIGQDSKNMAMLCHLLGLLTSFLGPLILWLIKKDEDAFVDSQGKEALNFQITVMIAMCASGLLAFMCIGVVLLPLVWLANIVFCILACIAASKGEDYRYPFCLRLVK